MGPPLDHACYVVVEVVQRMSLVYPVGFEDGEACTVPYLIQDQDFDRYGEVRVDGADDGDLVGIYRSIPGDRRSLGAIDLKDK